MTDTAKRALLPAGLADVLPPDAGFEADVMENLVAAFAARGYERVKPPLIEFEDSLLSGSGAATARQTFRLMDPVSQRMLGLRPDMTPQIARIAVTRLRDVARPLRLSYAGEVVRVTGSTLRPERQFGQVGAELIGSPAPLADAEVILMAVEALNDLGIAELTVDLGAPAMMSLICEELGLDLDAEDGALRTALNHKDMAAISALDGRAAELLGRLVDASGPWDRAGEAIAAAGLAAAAAEEFDHLVDVAEVVKELAPSLNLTIDPVEMRGYEYHTGPTFTFFARDVRGELGRGGRYLTDTGGEPATGITLFMDSLMRALPRPETNRRVYLPASASAADGAKLRADGWLTVACLDGSGDPMAEARRLNCSHLFDAGRVVPLDQ